MITLPLNTERNLTFVEKHRLKKEHKMTVSFTTW